MKRMLPLYRAVIMMALLNDLGVEVGTSEPGG